MPPGSAINASGLAPSATKTKSPAAVVGRSGQGGYIHSMSRGVRHPRHQPTTHGPIKSPERLNVKRSGSRARGRRRCRQGRFAACHQGGRRNMSRRR